MLVPYFAFQLVSQFRSQRSLHVSVFLAQGFGIARGIAKFAAGTGVTVNSVLPGPTLSDGARAMVAERAAREGKSTEDTLNEFVMETRGSSIIRRAASMDEVANMVLYAGSMEASATTGAALRVDGGIVDSIA